MTWKREIGNEWGGLGFYIWQLDCYWNLDLENFNMPWIWRRENVNERDGSVRHGTFVDARDRDEGIRKAGSSPGESRALECS